MVDHQGFNAFLTPAGPHPKSLAHNWELHKATIKKLYVDQYNSLKDVMTTMEIDHDFKASKKVYRRKLAKWGFERKLKGVERDAIVRKLVERGAIGKNSAFMVRRKMISVWRLSDESNDRIRTRKHVQDVVSQGNSGATTPPHVRCYTPEPDTWPAGSSAAFRSKYAEDIEAYKMRSTWEGVLTGGTHLQYDNVPQLSINTADLRGCKSQGLS